MFTEITEHDVVWALLAVFFLCPHQLFLRSLGAERNVRTCCLGLVILNSLSNLDKDDGVVIGVDSKFVKGQNIV